MKKVTVLAFIQNYLPGYKSGGPVRSLSNMVEELADSIDFRIITSDRDLGDDQPYSDVVLGRWTQVGSAKVFYLSERQQNSRYIINLLQETEYDVMYVNSFFNYEYAIKPLVWRRLGLVPNRPTVLAPRGEFSPGALRISALKKRSYLTTMKALGLELGIWWQASSEFEASDIEAQFPRSRSRIRIAPNLSRRSSTAAVKREFSTRSEHDPLRIVFLSRISPKKNLDYALRVLGEVREQVTFSIYGPIGDNDYWDRCQRLINELPQNISVEYKGAIPHEEVSSVLRTYDLLFFPTKGENFGHVIAEALSAGTPVLVSDATPWRNLAALGVGFDLPLDDPASFSNAIARYSALPKTELEAMSSRAIQLMSDKSHYNDTVDANRLLFASAVSG